MTASSFVTLGKFDGLHLGHQAIIHRLVHRARAAGARSVALVLHPDPAALLHGRSVPLLTAIDDRIAGLRALGVDHAEVLPFSTELAKVGAEPFIEMLANRWSMHGLVVGDDFVFGRGRSGDVGLLRRLAQERGFALEVVEALPLLGGRISSQAIRALVEEGRVEDARALLGRDYSLVGQVVHGAKRGRQLGFPTANLVPTAAYVVPANGVYAVWARPQVGDGQATGAQQAGSWLRGAANIGVRPQFDGGDRSIEVHLLDFEGDLYGAWLRVAFVSRLRDESRFPDVAALLVQMERDTLLARGALDRRGAPR